MIGLLRGSQGPEGPRGLQGIPGNPGIVGEQSWTISLGVLRESSTILEGSSFPKSFTFSPLGKPSTLSRVIGLVSLIGGSAIVTFQKGSIGSFTNISGLTSLGVTQIPVDFLASGANNSLQAGERLRLLFSSISGAVNLSFTIIYTEP